MTLSQIIIEASPFLALFLVFVAFAIFGATKRGDALLLRAFEGWFR